LRRRDAVTTVPPFFGLRLPVTDAAKSVPADCLSYLGGRAANMIELTEDLIERTALPVELQGPA
jgi:hypothetical protein